jgi:hypothetical protein
MACAIVARSPVWQYPAGDEGPQVGELEARQRCAPTGPARAGKGSGRPGRLRWSTDAALASGPASSSDADRARSGGEGPIARGGCSSARRKSGDAGRDGRGRQSPSAADWVYENDSNE